MPDHENGTVTTERQHTLFLSIEGESTMLSADCTPLDSISDVLKAAGRLHGRSDLEEFLISLEDADDETALTAVVRDALGGKRRGRFHLHRCHRVKVGVEYNNSTIARDFSPASTVQRVLTWAVGQDGFKVEADAHDLVLQVAGTTVPLAPSVHIGTLLRERRCELSLELVPKDRVQG